MGDGDEHRGSEFVTETMKMIGLKNTFLIGPIFEGDGAPTPVPQPINLIKTEADQVVTDPDPLSQSTPADLGWLLTGLYQCANDGTGPLISNFAGEYNMNECRQIVRVMRADKIGALIEAGVPVGVEVAHKHGWVDEVHGDAGLVTTTGGDYVLTVMLRNKTWLDQQDSFPLIAEISRATYNAYNPTTPLAQTHTENVPECTIDTISRSLLDDLQSNNLPPIR
jgi:beta-lactamase class A